MKTKTLPLGELILLAGTRALAGAGVGLLLAGRLNETQRRTAGWTLLLIGAASTLPLGLDLFAGEPAVAVPDPRPAG